MIQHRPRTQAYVTAVIALLCFLTPSFARASEVSDTARITASGDVLKELLDSPSGISHDLLNKAYCVIVLPSVKKGGFIVAAQYGRGIMTCRSGNNFDGPWTAPIMMQSSGGSIGFQIGGQETDFVILVMNDKGARAVMNGRAKLGSDASVAAGPVGRTAEASTNASLGAEMLSYSRSQGVFAGLSLSGASLGPDDDADAKVYGQPISGRAIFAGGVDAPPAAGVLLSTLKTTSPARNK
jgi:lipid-binding SYLF domain-containing protein